MRTPQLSFSNPFTSLSRNTLPEYLAHFRPFFERYGTLSREGKTIVGILDASIKGGGLLENLITQTTVIMNTIIRHHLLHPVATPGFLKFQARKSRHYSDPFYFFTKHINLLARVFHQISFEISDTSVIRTDFESFINTISVRHYQAIIQRLDAMDKLALQQKSKSVQSTKGEILLDFTIDALAHIRGYWRCIIMYKTALSGNNNEDISRVLQCTKNISKNWTRKLFVYREKYKNTLSMIISSVTSSENVIREYLSSSNKIHPVNILVPFRPTLQERAITLKDVCANTIEYSGSISPANIRTDTNIEWLEYAQLIQEYIQSNDQNSQLTFVIISDPFSIS
jgi:hypothetical protein